MRTPSPTKCKEQRGLNGIARTKIAFSSDRDGDRIRGPVGDRGISNIYMSDYDGARQQRVTISKSLDISPVWSPDSRSIAFASWRTGYQDIYVLYPYGGPELQNPTRGNASKQNYLPAWSPDGSKLAFTTSRDGQPEIYVMNRDGSGCSADQPPEYRRHANVVADGRAARVRVRPHRHAADLHHQRRRHTSSRSRASRCRDRPTWSPAPLNEIAFSARSGGGNIIKVFDFATRSTRALTDNVGNNESPAFSPNGRHIAFVSSRAGKEQIFTIHRDGSGLRQITRTGTNRYPHWSK